MVQASTYSRAILVFCTAGIALSAYGYVVKVKKLQDPKYQSLCDINEQMSCSRVLTSEYAQGFGLVRHALGEESPLNAPNTLYGGAFFLLYAALSIPQRPWAAKAQVGLGVVANLASVYLGAILFFVLQDFCLLCVSTYAVNYVNLVLSYLRLRASAPAPKQGKAGKKQKDKGQAGDKQQQQQQQKKKDKQQQQQQKSPQADKQKQQKQNQNEKQKQQQNDKQKQQQNDKQKQQQNEKQKQQQNDKQKQQQNEKQKQKDKQNQQNQQNGKIKNQQNDKQKSPKSPNSKKKNN